MNPNPARLRSSTVCIFEKRLLTIRLRDPRSQREYRFPPGGGIETGETPAEAAVRETLEETGYRVVVNPASQLIFKYPFTWAGITYDCTTHLFRALLADVTPEEISGLEDPAIHRGVEWIPVAEIAEALDYDVNIRDAVLQILEG